MADENLKVDSTPFVQYASHWTLVFSGSLIVLSIALKIVGVDFEPVIDAWSETIIERIHAPVEVECVQGIPMIDLSPRIEALESVSHAQGGAK